MAIYMKYGSIKGPVTTDGFKDWIELESFHWGSSRHIGTAARGSTSREHSEPTLSEITVTKRTDVASPKLFLDSVARKLDGKVETFLTYSLEDTGVSNYSLTSGGDMPMESLSLNFTKITKTFKGTDPGIGGSPETVGYNLAEMKSI